MMLFSARKRTMVMAVLLAVAFLPLRAAAAPMTGEDQDSLLRTSEWYSTKSYSAAGCGAGGGGTLSGDNNAAKVFNFLTSKGLTPAQAAGVVGNMILESGINPQRLQGTGLKTVTPASQITDPSTGWGSVQWTPNSKMIKPTMSAQKDPNDLSIQLDYLWNELSTNESAALAAVRATSTPEAAAQAFGAKYERPADLSASLSIRQTYAKAIFDNSSGVPLPPQVADAIFSGTGSTPATPGSQPPSPSCGGSTGTLTGYQNPFRDLKNSHSMRLDGGLDYGGDGVGSGPVYAVGNAKVTYVKVGGSGWPGLGTGSSGAYISYTFTDGAANGLSIYIAEDCTPRVKVGDIVNANTVVCDYRDQGTHLETGWGNGSGSYVSWSDYPGAANSFASNSGQDISRFLAKLHVGPGQVQGALSSVPPPANWPKW
jgi:hypothetical protein